MTELVNRSKTNDEKEHCEKGFTKMVEASLAMNAMKQKKTKETLRNQRCLMELVNGSKTNVE